jgi:hypothetical protein
MTRLIFHVAEMRCLFEECNVPAARPAGSADKQKARRFSRQAFYTQQKNRYQAA